MVERGTQTFVATLENDFYPEGMGDLRQVPGENGRLCSELHLIKSTLRGLRRPLENLSELVGKHREETDLWDLSIAIWTGILVQYSRCFDPSGQNGLRPKEVFTDPAELLIHEEAVEVRSKHLAHDVNRLRQVHTGVELSANGRFTTLVMPLAQMLPDEHVVENTARLVETALAFAERRQGEFAALVKAELAAMDKAERFALPKFKFARYRHSELKASRRQHGPGKKRR